MSESTHPAAPLELLDVVVGYRKDRPPVIDSLTARFEPASLTHLGGANGRGKTTLLELASGYLRPWAGSVAVGGHEASSEAARSLRRVCRTQPALYPSMTAMEHLEFAALCAGQSVDVALDRAQAYELSPWLGHEARELSTGNSRKLWIIMCTLGDFDLVVLDEPMNGLDTRAVQVLIEEIERWRQTKAVVLIAHQLPAGLRPNGAVSLAAPRDGATADAVAALHGA